VANVWHQTRQKGKRIRGTGRMSTYCRMSKAREADRYDRPYLTGAYKLWRNPQTGVTLHGDAED
jgi:hypothetical protein